MLFQHSQEFENDILIPGIFIWKTDCLVLFFAGLARDMVELFYAFKNLLDISHMNKDFSQWHQKKESINSEGDRAYFHEREIWWCSLGANVGFEQDGKGDNFARPVLIFKKFNKEIFWAIPISTKIKTGKFYYPINLSDNTSRCAILSQIRLLDGKRLLDKVGVINENDYAKIQKAVINLCSS